MAEKWKPINVLIVGAGDRSVPLLRMLSTVEQFKVIGIVDGSDNAPGIEVAKGLNIPTGREFIDFLKGKHLDLVIETSGSGEFLKTLKKIIPAGIEVLDMAATMLMLSLAAELDERVLELSLLSEANKTFSSSFDQSNIGTFAFGLLRKKFDFDAGILLLTDEEKIHMVLTTMGELDEGLKEELKVRICERFRSLSSERIVPEELPVIVEKIETSDKMEKAIEGPVKGFFSKPLIIADKVLGIMAIASYGKEHLISEDERFFNILTGQVALFIENDRIKSAIINEKNKLEAILEDMSEGVIAVDNHKRVILVNSAAEGLLGVKREGVLGCGVSEAIRDESIPAIFEMILGEKSRFISKEIETLSHEDGSRRIIMTGASKVYDPLGRISGLVLVMHDVTREREIDKVRSEFISTTSHELRTPLASIKEAISLVLDEVTGRVNENQKKFLGVARRNVDRLSILIGNLLDLSKIEAGKMAIERKLIDIEEVIDEALATFVLLADKKKIKLEKQVDKGVGNFYADRNKITQVLNNLISNGIKFTNEGGVIKVFASSYGSDHNYVEISVRDTGIGIAKKDFGKLFQRFQQLDMGITRKVGGSGLGLAVCKQFVELHGGRIWAESEGEGKGARFTFILPKEKEGKATLKKIMVVDDEPDLCETIKARLEAQNYNCITALSGQEGLDKVSQFKPDLIILDLMMPVMDGFTVLEKLKENIETSKIPVVILTALENEDSAKRALALKAEGYIVKPFEPDALLFTIREFLK